MISFRSLNRFLGYDVKQFTHEYVSFILDFILLGLLIFVLKPLALGLIYMELFLRLFLLSLSSILHHLKEFTPPSLIRRIIIRPYLNFMFYFTGGVGNLHQPHHMSTYYNSPQRIKRMRDLWECVRCVGSLTLLMKFFSGPPSAVEISQHKKLAKISLFYRMFHHFI